MAKMPKPLLDDHALYLCDNGACYCGKHCGASAQFTGRDISGQKVERVTPEDQAYYLKMLGHKIACESCGLTTSTLHTPSPSAINAFA